MKKLGNRQIKRLLSARGTPEPPEGLADRIRAEIPEVLHVGAAGLKPEDVRAVPRRTVGLRPLWLAAASVLVVVGAGFMVVHLLAPPDDLARRIALDGVTRIEDVVVTVPMRGAVEQPKMAMAKSKGSSPVGIPRPPAASKGRTNSKVERVVGPSKAAQGAEREIAAALPESEVTGDATAAGGHGRISAADRSATSFEKTGDRMAAAPVPDARAAFKGQPVSAVAPAAFPTTAANGSLIVEIHDADGKPVVGATVLLALSDHPDVNCGFRTTGAAGVAFFCCVAPGSYRICAQHQSFLPATTDGVAITSRSQPTIRLTMCPAPADDAEHPWTCPTPHPPATH